MKKRIPTTGATERVRALLRDLRLPTVCQSARCPNLCECFAKGTATFMILGDCCTRDCGFCAVPHGKPPPPDPTEPARLAEAVAQMKLRHVVVTSVTRDDLPDGGAAHFAATIRAVRDLERGCTIEVLTPDFQGARDAVARVVRARPDVYNHNLETVRRLYPTVRPAADYDRSVALLAEIKRRDRSVAAKSGIMVGVGEREDEVLGLMADLRAVGCDVLTIGQYLQPTERHLPIDRFVTPEEFARYEVRGGEMGFRAVLAGPFVRSSYRAGCLLDDARRAASGPRADEDDAATKGA
jgi:lipoic acid synthetase